MFLRIVISLIAAMLLTLAATAEVNAEGVLDGHSFSGMIGPAEDPDLEDSLYFDDGHFWSAICTSCGFAPGPYLTEQTADGLRFTGTLESESRGRFEYDGLVRADGSIRVSITWERRRWYWTSRREILFVGERTSGFEMASLSEMRQEMKLVNPESSPLCSRF
ncbi:hypothetical protein SAMN04488239_102296 [Ruegeria marina]|uniref:Uncharacterized protein n=2 Tax=Ruegeria marina TaxID=639004 RepID=A0A1G6LPW4_9RHOB|nr:hypothetical protein SAMN04488239_102296 [Ruegeria marina]